LRSRTSVKSFGTYTAVAGISLDVCDGEFLIMVGPSGCGKTTTLNMISGLETPTGGEISIGGRVVNDLEPGERGLGMVFQDLALFPHMTVFENIAFGLRVRKLPAAEISKRVVAAAETMHIKPLLAKLPKQCSGGRKPARRARPHDRDQSKRVSDGRAPLEPRRQAKGRHAYRTQATARALKGDLHLRDA
jgi:ABC-type sugar transport system ATPase subunit